GLRKPQGERERHEPLLGAVVEIPLQAAALRVLRLDQARAGRADLPPMPLALGDVDAAEELLGAVVEAGQRPARPVDQAPLAGLRHELGGEVADAAGGHARIELGPDSLDLLRRDDELPELPPAR